MAMHDEVKWSSSGGETGAMVEEQMEHYDGAMGRL